MCAFLALGIQYAMRMCHIYHLWPATLSNIFPQILINGTILETPILSKCVFRVPLQHLSDIFFILRRTERDMMENVYWASRKVHFINE